MILILALILASLGQSAAYAQTQATQDCLSTYESTQRLLKRGDLQGAHAAAVVCSQPVCGRLLSQDCRRWLNEIEMRQPSVTLTFARGLCAGDLASVSVGGTALKMPWDGRAVAVNPGKQAVHVRLTDGVEQREEMVIAEGVRGQVILIRGAAKKQTVIVDPVAKIVTPAVQDPPGQLLRWTVTGSAVAGLATFATFGIKGFLQKRDLQRECAPNCERASKSDLERDFLIADIGLGAGLAFGAWAAWLWWHAADAPHATHALDSWSLAHGSGGSTLLLRGHF